MSDYDIPLGDEQDQGAKKDHYVIRAAHVIAYWKQRAQESEGLLWQARNILGRDGEESSLRKTIEVYIDRRCLEDEK